MSSVNVLFLMLGAVMILAMHVGFAFLEAGSASRKNQVNAFSTFFTLSALSGSSPTLFFEQHELLYTNTH